MISMAFYWSLTVTQFIDVKRKDFWQMFIHHMVTLLLMSLSWVCNLHRVGSLVLVVHDCADIFLEVNISIYIFWLPSGRNWLCHSNMSCSFQAAKLTKYANYQKLCDFIFAIFTIVWIVTRLGFYPRIIYRWVIGIAIYIVLCIFLCYMCYMFIILAHRLKPQRFFQCSQHTTYLMVCWWCCCCCI